MKHGGTVLATVRQQMYCTGNLEQDSGEVPAPSALRKAKLWNDSRNGWRNAGHSRAELFLLDEHKQKIYRDLKAIDTIPDESFFFSSVLVGSAIQNGRFDYQWINSNKKGRKRTSTKLRHIILI